MKKILLTILLASQIFMSCISSEEIINYQNFHSFSEVIFFESQLIDSVSENNPQALSESYAARGETLLLNNQISEALNDFCMSYYYASQVQDEHISPDLLFRSLFGQALAYAYLDKVKEVECIATALLDIIQSIRCSDCSNKTTTLLSPRTIRNHPIFLLANNDNVPIHGPDQISIQDCIDLIENTRAYAKLLILKAPARVRGILTFTVDQLADTGRSCCRAGGVWKACFQPLANKYHLWNQKWKMFGIPPDPAWD